jgi:hypothetical protein
LNLIQNRIILRRRGIMKHNTKLFLVLFSILSIAMGLGCGSGPEFNNGNNLSIVNGESHKLIAAVAEPTEAIVIDPEPDPTFTVPAEERAKLLANPTYAAAFTKASESGQGELLLYMLYVAKRCPAGVNALIQLNQEITMSSALIQVSQCSALSQEEKNYISGKNGQATTMSKHISIWGALSCALMGPVNCVINEVVGIVRDQL